MTKAEDAAWEYLRVIVNDEPTTQLQVAVKFGVGDAALRANFQKILKKHGWKPGKTNISTIKRFLEKTT